MSSCVQSFIYSNQPSLFDKLKEGICTCGITANRTKEGVEGEDAVWEQFGGQEVFQLSFIHLNREANFLCVQP